MATTNEPDVLPPVPDAGGGRPAKEILPSIVRAVCLAAFLVKALTSLVQESSTWDETSYLGLGKDILQNQRWDAPGAILHPPLSYYLHDLPLWFFPTDQNLWKLNPARVNDLEYLGMSDTFRGQKLLASPANRGDRLLILSRLMMVLTAVLLGWFVYAWSYSLYGKWSAMLAVGLYSFCPNILANARLITPDITLTTFSFIALYYFWRLLQDNRPGDAVRGGAAFGLALLSKFSSVLLFPIGLLLLVIWGVKRKTLNWRLVFLFAVIGIGVLFLGYGMNLKPYFEGILYQQAHANQGHRGFLIGQYSTRGWWYYFIVAFLVKTPIVTMIFLAVALGVYVRRLRQGTWINELFLLVPVAVIFGFFSLNHKAIGLRYVLPIYPFLFVFASQAARSFLSGRLRTGLGAAAIAWYVGASCWIHPHYLAYFNELAGGPDNGYQYLVDSNLDWGQDLKGLKSYLQKNGISRINLSYFGSDSPARYGIAYDWLPSHVLLNRNPKKLEFAPKGWVAISATCLQGLYLEDKDTYAWFRGRQPVAKIGYSIFIYKVPD